MDQVKLYCSELEQELSMAHERGLALRSDLVQTQNLLEQAHKRQYVEDNSRERLQVNKCFPVYVIF